MTVTERGLLRPARWVMTNRVPKRILLVDDAVVVRKVLSQAIGQDPDLEVVATAVERACRTDKIRGREAGSGSSRRRNARDGWTGDGPRIAQDRLACSHHYVQHLNGTRGFRHARGVGLRRHRLHYQAQQPRRRCDLRCCHSRTPSQSPRPLSFAACARANRTPAESDPSRRTASHATPVGWSRQDRRHRCIHLEAPML